MEATATLSNFTYNLVTRGVALRSKHGATHRPTKTHVYMQPRSLADVTDPGCLTTLSAANKELENAQLEVLCRRRGQSG